MKGNTGSAQHASQPGNLVAFRQQGTREKRQHSPVVFPTSGHDWHHRISPDFVPPQGVRLAISVSFLLAQAWRHPTMHPPDIDDKYDFIRVFSRNGYE
ncbi:hypothetical protein [Janthinobacterium sp. GMG1]|uniref:hypothetical protein n=1 Tax=Janthinobacterium sp. GMG1 TaxID=3096007 RepID=UPI002ACA9EF4|nr:hypothetical protein [Janthinobacterium sp. GMG1]MDZ5634860.1 hypothetical protein [Janthinobacterium sp. GMG1]